MSLADIEQSIHEQLDSADPDTLALYAEHCTESMNPLVEALCLAIIRTDFRAWASVMALTCQKLPDLADALEAIERHIDKQRASFIESRASKLADEAEHNSQMLAELNAELNRDAM
jgi:hypothetical protein